MRRRSKHRFWRRPNARGQSARTMRTLQGKVAALLSATLLSTLAFAAALVLDGSNLYLFRLSTCASLLTVCLTFLVIRRIVQPIKQMAAAAQRFAQDDLSPRLRVRGKDEIAELGRALNAMADGLTASRNE